MKKDYVGFMKEAAGILSKPQVKSVDDTKTILASILLSLGLDEKLTIGNMSNQFHSSLGLCHLTYTYTDYLKVEVRRELFGGRLVVSLSVNDLHLHVESSEKTEWLVLNNVSIGEMKQTVSYLTETSKACKKRVIGRDYYGNPLSLDYQANLKM
jgi:hypothetical protein